MAKTKKELSPEQQKQVAITVIILVAIVLFWSFPTVGLIISLLGTVLVGTYILQKKELPKEFGTTNKAPVFAFFLTALIVSLISIANPSTQGFEFNSNIESGGLTKEDHVIFSGKGMDDGALTINNNVISIKSKSFSESLPLSIGENIFNIVYKYNGAAEKKQIIVNRTTQENYESEQKRLAVVAEKNKAVKERASLIESQFSTWDGSHLNLTKVIKQNMNDPDSYEHVETKYWDYGDHLIVVTNFRGKNAFGAVVINSIKAKVSLNGDIVKIFQ